MRDTPNAAELIPLGDDPVTPVVVVTGMSGAGRSTALKALEDLGYEAVDNLPLSLLSSLLTPGTAAARPLAIGVDARTRDFGPAPFLEELDELIRHRKFIVRVLFLNCDSEVLQRRFSETRRRHPVTPDRRVTDGIKRERAMLEPLRDRADEVIDTTDMAIRFLKNPHYVENLRPLSGLDKLVGDFIEADPDLETYFSNLTTLLEPLLPRFDAEGKSYLTVAVGCTGGKHRSVYLAERLGAWLETKGERVSVNHRDLKPDG